MGRFRKHKPPLNPDLGREFRKTIVYIIGEDLTEEDFGRWTTEIALWISQTKPNVEDPMARAREIMHAAISGTNLKGDPWKNVDWFSLDKRILQFCGYDILNKTGRESARKKPTPKEVRQGVKLNTDLLLESDIKTLRAFRDDYREILLREFPHLDNPVYAIKVSAYCDTVIKLEVLSDQLLGAEGGALKNLLELRGALKKDIDDFMKLLKIHPTQVKETVDEKERGDVGGLINKWESFGELAHLYESVDAVQEAIQIIHQLESIRLDGPPQLADWLLWHKTSCRGHRFKCECGKEYDIHGGFTKEEMYKITETAYKVFGYGIKPLERNYDKRSKVNI